MFSVVFDVCFVQETFVNNVRKANNFRDTWEGECFWSFGTEHRAGVGLLFHKNLDFSVLDICRNTDGRVLSVLFKWRGVYAPVDVACRKQFFRNLYQYVHANSYVVLGGDFNCVLSDCDSSSTSGSNKGGARELTDVLEDFDLVDLWVHYWDTCGITVIKCVWFFFFSCLLRDKMSMLRNITISPLRPQSVKFLIGYSFAP